MTELKLCPFCGAELTVSEDTATHPGAIDDDDCLFSGKVFPECDWDKWERRMGGDDE